MMAKLFNFLGTLPALAVLGACAAPLTGARGDAATCRAEAASALVGRPAPDDAAILRRTGGTTVRRMAPGDMATQDYRPDRVTVRIDDGRVVAASCG
jgi:hypothetical protein